jgi:integrase
MILRVVKGSIAEGPAILAVGCGVRLGEALALRWQDCDIEGSRIRVTGTMHRGGRTEPKTPRSRRTVAVPGFALGWLKEHRTAQAARRLASAAWLEDGYVFDRGGGVPMSVESVGRRFAQLVETVGLEQVRFHDLRHAFDPATRGEHQPRRSSQRLWVMRPSRSRSTSTAMCCPRCPGRQRMRSRLSSGSFPADP